MIREIISSDLRQLNLLMKNIDSDEIITNSIFNHPFSKYLVYTNNNDVVAFLKYSIIYDRIEIDYVYTDKKFRRKGYSLKLLNYVIEKYDDFSILLEVRRSNIAAISLYQKCGFFQKNIRKNYYGNEDGITFIKESLM